MTRGQETEETKNRRVRTGEQKRKLEETKNRREGKWKKLRTGEKERK